MCRAGRGIDILKALEQVTGINALFNAQQSFKVRSICIHYLIVISFRYEVNVDTTQCVWFELSMQSTRPLYATLVVGWISPTSVNIDNEMRLSIRPCRFARGNASRCPTDVAKEYFALAGR